MADKITYRKIITGLPLHPKEAFIHKDGKTDWNPYWVERVLDYQGYFTIVLESVIDEKIGEETTTNPSTLGAERIFVIYSTSKKTFQIHSQ